MNRPTNVIRAALVGAFAIAFFVFSWVVRYNEPEGSFAGLLDDHYFYLVRGWQMLYGEWPDRDFVDIGAPLTYVLSAGAQLIGGRGTLPEIVLCVTMLSVAAAFSFYAATRASGSIVAASIATLFQIALSPRLYNYSKVITYALAIPATWALVDRPSWGRRVALAAITVAALLLRHDHGVFVTMLVVVTMLFSTMPRSEKVRELIRYIALVVLLTLPYLAYLQFNGGVVSHFATANAWSMRDRGRAPLIWPPFTFNLVSWLFYVWLAIPLGVAVLLWRSRDAWRPDWWDARAKIGGVAVLAMILNIGFLRGALAARLADVIVPHTILIAWLLMVATRAVTHRELNVIARFAIPLLIVAAFAVPAVPLFADFQQRLGRSHISFDPGGVVGRIQEITDKFRTIWPLDRWASPTNNPSMELIFYLDACTKPTDHVFVSQYMPQVPALARRPFAGGHPDLRPGFFMTERDQALFIRRIERQHVPVLFVPTTADYPHFADDFPMVDRYFAGRYGPVFDRALGDAQTGVRIANGVAPTGHYDRLDLPCFK